jgi:hypothetical protein
MIYIFLGILKELLLLFGCTFLAITLGLVLADLLVTEFHISNALYPIFFLYSVMLNSFIMERSS